MPRRYGATASSSEEERLLDVARCDHYPNNNSDDNNDSDDDDGSSGGSLGGLTPVGGRRKKKRRTALGKCGRGKSFASLLILPLLFLAFLALWYSRRLQTRLSALSSELETTSANLAVLSADADARSTLLAAMNATLTNHSSVISRFEHSVSNSDVLMKLKELQVESREREERVRGEMEETKSEVRGVLRETKEEIDMTVSNATTQINKQVLTVQSSLSGYIRTTQDQFSTENSFMIYQLAGTITLIGCLISMWHMTNHLRNFRQPFVQRKILAILWMCPIYSITSWLSLVMPGLEGYLAILKDLYEAYVIYTFLSFCIAVLGKGDRNAVVELLAKHADHLSPPVRCFGCCRKRLGVPECEDEKMRLADDVLLQCQVCAMQFVFLRPLLTTIMFVLKKVDYHGPMFGPGGPFDRGGEGEDYELAGGGGGIMDYRSPQFYIIILENVSVFLAFSGLLNFYHAVQEDLSWCRPFPKFLCIKGVVFMTFWQGVCISLLANTTDILSSGSQAISPNGNGDDEDQVEQWAKQAQNFLICLEMLGFAIAHFYCFPVEEWEEGYRPVENEGKFGDNMALGDFLHDLKLILRHKEKKKGVTKKDKSGRKPSDDSISTVLEEDEELGRTDSSDEGLHSLIDNVEDLLEESGADDSSKSTAGAGQRGNDSSPGKSNLQPSRTYRKSIQESLEAMNAPTELRQATALLLQSSLLDENTARLLTSDILDHPFEKNDDKGEGQCDEGSPAPGETKQSAEDSCVEGSTVDGMEGDGAPASTADNETILEEEMGLSESTSLLMASSTNDEMLRPSIFTMHSTSPPKD